MDKRKKIKLRRATRYTIMLVAVILFVQAVLSLYFNLFNQNINVQTKNVDTYTEKFNCKYIVNLRQNEFITDITQDMGKNYITDLIDNVDLNMTYNCKMKSSQNIKYSYKVVGTIVGVYTNNGVEEKIWEKEYDLTEEKTGHITGTEVKVSENINVDVAAYNEIVKKFENSLNINLDATLKIQLKVNLQAKNETIQYVSDTQMDLGEKTTKISGNFDDEKTGYTVENVEQKQETNMLVTVLNIITIIGSVGCYSYISTHTKPARSVKNTYRLELNRILKLCQDKIVQVKNKPNFADQNVIDVKDFGEIIKVSEELFKPILYWDSKDDEAWFAVMSNNVAYRYILK